MRFELLERTTLYRGFFRMEKLRLRFQSYHGGWIGPIEREMFERGNAVAVLPYDPDRDEVVLIEQFRPGALDAPSGPWLLEIVAGMVEAGEEPAEVACREAREEAGLELTCSQLIPITRYWVSPGGTTESIQLYAVRVDSTRAEGLHGLTEEHEDIRVHVLPLDEALRRVKDGTICSAAPIITLQWLALNRDMFA